MGAISPSQLTTAYCVIFGVRPSDAPHAGQDDHAVLQDARDPMLRFWVRGFSVTVFAICFTLYKLMSFDATLATQIAVASTAGTAVFYPFNAKFGYFDKLPVIYPKHYEPEIPHGGLLAVGAYALATARETRRLQDRRASRVRRGRRATREEEREVNKTCFIIVSSYHASFREHLVRRSSSERK